MNLQIIFGWARKIHKWTMWLAILLGVPLALSGVIMEEDGWRNIFTFDQMIWIRGVHREISTKFVLVLAIMIVTGLLMWVIPKIIQSRNVVKS